MLEGGGDMLTPETDNVLSHITSEDLVERSRLLGLVINGLRNLPRDEVGLLQRLNQIPELGN